MSKTTCSARISGTVKKSVVGATTKTLGVKAEFGGNAVLAASVQPRGTLAIKRHG